MPEEQLPNLGRPGEPCEECGSPLAADQRYCLECGHRRGAPRVDYRAEMAREADGPGPQGQPTSPQPADAEEKEPPKGGRERDYAPLAAVGGIAVLGLMLLVGVLIGKGNSTASAPATPQVVRVTGAGESESEQTTGGGDGGGTTKKSAASGKKKQQGGSGGGKDKEVVEASTNELEELENESGEDAAKKALELPNKIATPGKPPPIDKSEPPGGGEGGGITIK
ncbi:MAG: hypothetical protein JJE35_15955 [Thermoleophilia bacterium]|nr:hypothetical protein [Thermoleophilia bacterium]